MQWHCSMWECDLHKLTDRLRGSLSQNYPSINLSIFRSVWLSVYLSGWLAVYLSIYIENILGLVLYWFHYCIVMPYLSEVNFQVPLFFSFIFSLNWSYQFPGHQPIYPCVCLSIYLSYESDKTPDNKVNSAVDFISYLATRLPQRGTTRVAVRVQAKWAAQKGLNSPLSFLPLFIANLL